MGKIEPRALSEWIKYKGQWAEISGIKVDLGDVSKVNSTALMESLDKPAIVDIRKFDELKNNTYIKIMKNGVQIESH